MFVIISSIVFCFIFSTVNGYSVIPLELKNEVRDIWLFRVLGNDLPPLQSMGQTYNNLKYILENEGDLPHVTKAYIINRIIDDDQRNNILQLLKSHNVDRKLIVERGINWQNLPSNEKDRLNYFTSINEARNMAINYAISSGAKWIVLNDGNIFMTKAAWSSILKAEQNSNTLYISSPLVRLAQKQETSWLGPWSTRSSLSQKTAWEHQEGTLSFRHNAPARFKENIVYGEKDKWELLEELCGTPKPDEAPPNPEKYPNCQRLHEAVVRLWPYPEKGAEVAITDAGKRWELRKISVDNFIAKFNRIAKEKNQKLSSNAMNGNTPDFDGEISDNKITFPISEQEQQQYKNSRNNNNKLRVNASGKNRPNRKVMGKSFFN